MTVLPLTVEQVQSWAIGKGDDVAGVAGASLGCPLARCAADLLGVRVRIDFDPASDTGWGEYENGERVQLPAPLTALAMWLDETTASGRYRRHTVTGVQVLRRLARMAS